MALSLFLVMALMTMKLLDLANLAGPLLVILAAQAVVMILFTVFVTYRVMGAQLRRGGDHRRAGRLRPVVDRVRARHHEGGDRAPRRLARSPS